MLIITIIDTVDDSTKIIMGNAISGKNDVTINTINLLVYETEQAIRLHKIATEELIRTSEEMKLLRETK